VTIDYGLNDRGQGLKNARAAWVSMIEAALAKNVKVILLTPTPDTRSNLKDPRDRLHQHANQIRELAKKYNVGLVDSLAEFDRATKGTKDFAEFMATENHPNREGHALVANALLEWLSAAAPVTNTTVK
jgi:lysophospholipase L1-like esterase